MVAGTWCLRRSFHFERLTCSKAVSAISEEITLTTRLKPSHSEQAKACFEIEVLDIEERSLLSFQRPVPCLKDGVKKTSDSRQEASEGANRSLYESGLEAPMVELQGFPTRVRSDGP
jgi:hypothetical protein